MKIIKDQKIYEKPVITRYGNVHKITKGLTNKPMSDGDAGFMDS